MSRLTFTSVALASALLAGASNAQQAAVPSRTGPELFEVATFDHQVTGVTVSEGGRIFVNFPRWTEDAPISVAEVVDGEVRPYPNEEWNAWRNARKNEVSLFLEVGPDAPTLSGDWTTRDLAAHMVIRERRPDAAVGIVAAKLARYGERVRVEEAERPYEEIIERLRGGPPIWSPTRVDAVDALADRVDGPDGAARERLVDLVGRHVALALVHPAAHRGFDGHPRRADPDLADARLSGFELCERRRSVCPRLCRGRHRQTRAERDTAGHRERQRLAS